jgi:hypothetical protein
LAGFAAYFIYAAIERRKMGGRQLEFKPVFKT